MKRPWTIALVSTSALLLAASFAGCGSSDGSVTIGDGDGGDEGGDGNTSASDANGSGGDSSTKKDSGSGSSDSGGADGSNFFEGGVIPDASRADGGTCHASGDMCATSSDCCSANCDKTTSTCGAPISGCKLPGVVCLSGLDCCTGSCVGGTCSNLACVKDNLACAANTDCCGGSCAPNAMGGGTCAPLPTAGGCKSINNACNVDSDCCSKDCHNGSCAAPSYCGQNGDTCGNNNDCCGGICTKVGSAVLGLCSQPDHPSGVPQCTIDGELCGGLYVGGAFQCGGTCCSKSCRPFAPTGYLICQPASGCHPTGEVCDKDTDCCGAVGLPYGATTQVVCSGKTATTPGRCANGNTCSPPGNVCKLSGTSCSTSDVCCGTKPNGMAGGLSDQQYPLICQQDNLGIPRCLGTQTLDCTMTDAGSLAGKACASSADCCGDPCLPNGAGTGFICGSSACVNPSGVCTTTADCCSGASCTITAGSSSGICGGILEADGGILPPPDGGSGGADGGMACSQYGQLCVNASDCCSVNNIPIPCTSGRCLTP